MFGSKHKDKEVQAGENVRIRDWKGLLGDDDPKIRLQVFGLLMLSSAAMTFMQFGFVGIGSDGDYIGYAFGLFAPVTACALLLGKGWGCLGGLISGIVLYLHARIQPLDIFEYYLVSALTSIVFYAVFGFLLGLFFAIALRRRPRRVWIRFAIIAFVVCQLGTLAFYAGALLRVLMSLRVDFESETVIMPDDMVGALMGIGGFAAQAFLNFFIILVTSLVVYRITRRWREGRDHMSVTTVFRVRLLVAVATTFMVVQAGIFAYITMRSEATAADSMDSQLTFIMRQVLSNKSDAESALSAGNFTGVDEDLVRNVAEYAPTENLIEAYNPAESTVIVFEGTTVAYSNSTKYQWGMTKAQALGESRADLADTLADTGETRQMVYQGFTAQELLAQERASGSAVGSASEAAPAATTAESSEGQVSQIGYARAMRYDDFLVMIVVPARSVFANRSSLVVWASLLAFAIAVVVYVAAAWLLARVVVNPIDRTNESLAKITQGDLDETVAETESVEFASLSAGINSTVHSLKGLIAEAETRMERDLATAKAIQESALPRTFPPFPEVTDFDIYASMNAAKEVGGDFYDFFLVDDHTLGFLIADVSGKGVPGALFMMAAKTEIENYLSTGMEPAEAILSANRRLCANNDAGMFVTVWAATLDYHTGLLTYVNAGHNFPLLRHGQGGEWEWLTKKCGLFLGTFDTAKYRQETLTMEPGDELLLYTDGVNEAFSVDEEEFGNDRLEAWLGSHADLGPTDIVHGLRAAVGAWAEGAEQSDDITILALEYGVAPDTTDSQTFVATLDTLGEAMGFITSELERRLCPASVINKIEVAFEELYVNVCRYAYAEEAEPGKVTVSYVYSADPNAITVELRDQGTPFDPLTLKDPTKPASIQEAKIGGLGILMVRKTMDDFTYLREGDTNVVAFRKVW